MPATPQRCNGCNVALPETATLFKIQYDHQRARKWLTRSGNSFWDMRKKKKNCENCGPLMSLPVDILQHCHSYQIKRNRLVIVKREKNLEIIWKWKRLKSDLWNMDKHNFWTIGPISEISFPVDLIPPLFYKVFGIWWQKWVIGEKMW